MNEETQDLLARTCEKYAAAHAKAVSELDEKQFAAVLEQMIKAGDFVKFVRGRGQQIIYLPYHDKQRLTAKNERLKDWQARAVQMLEYYNNTNDTHNISETVKLLAEAGQ